MIEVSDSWWTAIIIASIFGAIGGVAYELLQSRFGGKDTAEAGMIQWFSRRKQGNKTYLDLGIVGSMIIGAIAATAFLYFMPPTDVLNADGAIDARRYDPFRLVPGALIVGSAGGAFLTAMQERLKRVVSETSRKDAQKILAAAAEGDPGASNTRGGGGSAEIDPAAVQAALDVLGD